MIVVWQLTCMSLFAVAYLPQIPKLPLAQQLTVGIGLTLALMFTFAVVGMFIASVIYERPRSRAN